MNRFFRLTSPCFLVLGLALPATGQTGPRPGDAIRIRVFPYADVPEHALTGALAESQRLLGQAGVETIWIRCGAKQVIPHCTSSPTPLDIIVRVASTRSSTVAGHDPFGVAFVPGPGRLGLHASIFYDRIKEYSDRWQASEGLLLGHLIAHEIGHLLLGANSHSMSGIMQAQWKRQTIDQASRASLHFTPRQAQRMQDQVDRRFALSMGRDKPAKVVASRAKPPAE